MHATWSYVHNHTEGVLWVVRSHRDIFFCSLLKNQTVPNERHPPHGGSELIKARLGISETTCTSSGEYTSGDHGRQREL